MYIWCSNIATQKLAATSINLIEQYAQVVAISRNVFDLSVAFRKTTDASLTGPGEL